MTPQKPPVRRPLDLDTLDDRIAEGRRSAGLEQVRTRPDTAMGDGLRVAIEFFVSTLVGAGLGWFLGGLLGNAVIGLLVGLLFGFAAGLRGVYRGMMAGQDPQETNGDDAGTA